MAQLVKFTDEELIELLGDRVWLHPDGKPRYSALGVHLGVDKAAVQSRARKLAHQGRLPFTPAMPGFEITKVVTKEEDGSFVTQRPEAEEIVLPEGHIIERASLKVGDSWYKTRLAPGATTRDDLLEIFSEYRGKSELIQLPNLLLNSALTTVYTMSDLHLGMLAWGRETGVAWDLRVARDVIFSSMIELVQCSPPANTAVLLDLGDYTHNNNQTNATPASGHQLDVDGRFRKIAREAIKLRLELIELLLQRHNRVLVRALPGNHDPDVAQVLSAAFGVFFENNPRVEIDDDPSEFWAHEFGVNMFCANHGHKCKPDRLPGIMAARWPEMWGRTKVRQAWSGHIHHKTSDEEMGVTWETLRTAAPSDSFGHSHGYTAGRELCSWTYHLDRGFRQKQVVQIL